MESFVIEEKQLEAAVESRYQFVAHHRTSDFPYCEFTFFDTEAQQNIPITLWHIIYHPELLETMSLTAVNEFVLIAIDIQIRLELTVSRVGEIFRQKREESKKNDTKLL